MMSCRTANTILGTGPDGLGGDGRIVFGIQWLNRARRGRTDQCIYPGRFPSGDETTLSTKVFCNRLIDV
jgi:hypothetical protein